MCVCPAIHHLIHPQRNLPANTKRSRRIKVLCNWGRGWKRGKKSWEEREQSLSTQGEAANPFKESRSDTQHLFLSGWQWMARNSMAWQSTEWMAPSETQGRRRWGGTWLLEWDQWMSFNLGALYVGNGEGPLPPLLHLHTKSQRGSTGFHHLLTALADWETTKVQRCSCRQSPAKAFWCPSSFWGDRRQARGLLDVLPRTTSGEAAVCKRRRIGPGIKDGWRRKENSISKEGSHVIGVSQCL